jgi:Signal peptide binding domain
VFVVVLQCKYTQNGKEQMKRYMYIMDSMTAAELDGKVMCTMLLSIHTLSLSHKCVVQHHGVHQLYIA